MLKYHISDRKVAMKRVCVCIALQIARFRDVKAKMNVSVPSDVKSPAG